MSYDPPAVGVFRPTYTGSVASGCRVMNNYASVSSTSQWMARTRHRAAVALSTATKVQIGIPAFLVLTTYAEANFVGATSYTCAVEYPSGTIVAQATFGGSTTASQPAAITTLFTDPLTLASTIPAGAFFFVRIWGSNAHVLPYWNHVSTGADTSNGEGYFYVNGGTTPDTTMTPGANVAMAGSTGFRPTAIIGQTNKPTVIISGDSIAGGVHDLFSGTTGDVGSIERALGLANIAYISLPISGEAAYQYLVANDYQGREALAAFGTHRIIEYGINDLNVDAHIDTIARQSIVSLRNLTPSMPTFLTTLFPVCTSSDSFVTTTNQTPTSPFIGTGYDPRQAHNAWRRAVPPGFAGCFDMAAVLESGSTGKWAAPGGVAQTNEGVHPNPTSYLTLASSGAINTALFV